jgi:hypothetical protein
MQSHEEMARKPPPHMPVDNSVCCGVAGKHIHLTLLEPKRAVAVHMHGNQYNQYSKH